MCFCVFLHCDLGVGIGFHSGGTTAEDDPLFQRTSALHSKPIGWERSQKTNGTNSNVFNTG